MVRVRYVRDWEAVDCWFESRAVPNFFITSAELDEDNGPAYIFCNNVIFKHFPPKKYFPAKLVFHVFSYTKQFSNLKGASSVYFWSCEIDKCFDVFEPSVERARSGPFPACFN